MAMDILISLMAIYTKGIFCMESGTDTECKNYLMVRFTWVTGKIIKDKVDVKK